MTIIASSEAPQLANDADMLQSAIGTAPIALVPQPHSSYDDDRYDDDDDRYDDDRYNNGSYSDDSYDD
ncbi:MAG: hypothetical protein HC795_02250 [Coleofasciculaceae cyanobacterium RL_1_1]|nr:hypothetical protein [Coleofasciculaceae cyanobacterium RL_1_1]